MIYFVHIQKDPNTTKDRIIFLSASFKVHSHGVSGSHAVETHLAASELVFEGKQTSLEDVLWNYCQPGGFKDVSIGKLLIKLIGGACQFGATFRFCCQGHFVGTG